MVCFLPTLFVSVLSVWIGVAVFQFEYIFPMVPRATESSLGTLV
jgi:hypothetical protein